MNGPFVLMVIVLISSVPVIITYIWFRLAKYQFTLIQFLFVLLAGAAAFFPALILQDILNFSFSSRSRMELFYHVFFRIAFTEELSRMLMLFVLFLISGVFKNDSKESLSWTSVKKGTAAGFVAGLGFALLENAVYAASDTSVLLLRAVTAAPLHAACGARVGSAAVLIRTNPIQALFRILAAIAIHGIYNFMAAIPGFSLIIALLIALTALGSSILTIRGGWEKPEINP
jgi:RsiW-degrading membrane proteinase PrsW (M82 family)